MAKGKRKGGKKLPPPKKPEPLGMIWTVTAAIATAAAIGLFVCAAFPDWRVSDETVIHWYTDIKGILNNQKYHPARYGLFSISFNGGVTYEAWYLKASRVCGGIDAYAPYSAGFSTISNPPCPQSCISHFRTRCSVYNRLTTIGYVGLGSSIIVGLLALVGVTWLVVFGKSNALLQLFWLGGGVANICSICWWLYESDAGFTQLGLESQFPYPSVGPAAYGSLVCSFILISCGLFVMCSACLEDSQMWKAKQAEIDLATIGEPQGGPFAPAQFSPPFGQFAGAAGRPQTPPGFGGRPPPGAVKMGGFGGPGFGGFPQPPPGPGGFTPPPVGFPPHGMPPHPGLGRPPTPPIMPGFAPMHGRR